MSDGDQGPAPLSRPGVMYAVAAYGAWGVVPLFWKLLGGVDAVQILAHRVAWSLVLVAAMVVGTGRVGAVRAAVSSKRTVMLLLVSSVTIAINWGIFIWAVTAGRLVDASLGYFINPLVNVVLGVVLLRERLAKHHKVAVGLATVGLAVMVVGGKVSGLAVPLALAGSFALYGLCRKVVAVDAVVGLFLETVACAPAAVGYIAWREWSGTGALGGAVLGAGGAGGGGAAGAAEAWTVALLVMAGPVTALPLAAFAAAARRLPLSTLGFFQYLAPSLQFLIAVVAFGERVEAVRLVAFGLIWVALVVSSVGSIRAARR